MLSSFSETVKNFIKDTLSLLRPAFFALLGSTVLNRRPLVKLPTVLEMSTICDSNDRKVFRSFVKYGIIYDWTYLN